MQLGNYFTDRLVENHRLFGLLEVANDTKFFFAICAFYCLLLNLVNCQPDFLSRLKVVRPDVTLLSDMSNTWPPALLDMKAGDVLLVFDIRRYENSVLQLVELAVEQGACVVLVTDRWVSPAATHARHTLSCHVEAPSAWDSTVSILVLIETLLAAVQSLTWDQTEGRLKRLETLYDRSRFFRRHR